MEELKGILLDHAGRYPEMQPTDAVKLIYQNEFGGGHLIRDEQACLDYLRREYESVEKDASVPLWEDIGNGIVRVNLAALPEGLVPALGSAFLASAAGHLGSTDRFREKLAVLRDVTKQGAFAFDEAALEDYLSAYERAGFPPVSHSREYRDAYKPAYRIILASFLNNIQL